MRIGLLTTLCFMAFLGASQAQAESKKEAFARKLYEKIPGPAEVLTRSQDGEVVVGAHITQKTEDADTFCRATTAIAPNAPTSHACYGLMMEGDDAKAAYVNSPNSPLNVLFSINGQSRVGGVWNEKYVQDPDNGTTLICTETHAVVPNPVSTYRCFYELVPIGGGASIGN